MIRFSAGLVVVAIGVLIGGVATSKLSLVYVAIAVSAVALVVLAIGVALKRDELFGGGPESAPAGAGAGSGMPVGQLVGAGDVRGSAGHVQEDQKPIQQEGARTRHGCVRGRSGRAGRGRAVAAPTVAAPVTSVTTPTVASPTVGPAADNSPFGNPPLAHRRTAFGQAPAPEGDAAADWQTRSPQPPWSSGDQVRPTWTPTEQTPTASPPDGAAVRSRLRSPRARGGAPTSRPRRRPGPDRGRGPELVRPAEPARRRPGPVAPTGTDPAKAGSETAEPGESRAAAGRAGRRHFSRRRHRHRHRRR